MRDAPVRWRWQGVGLSPQPEVRLGAVRIGTNRVELSWPERGGWGVSRVAWICPRCGRRVRFLYDRPDGTLLCGSHLTKRDLNKERCLSEIRRARRLQKNNRWRAQGLRLENQVMSEFFAL